MSSGELQRLTEKKGKQLSKFLGIESVPDTHFIIKIQEKIKNPMFKLSMNDYEMMCGDKTMTKVMTKVFDCDLKQLKKFCKYINVFKDNINSSPESIKNKMKATNSINASMRKGSLSVLPDDILEKIVNKYKTLFSRVNYKLKDWIPIENIYWPYLSANPKAIELLKSKINEENEMPNDDYDDSDESNKIDWKWLSKNPNPEAIKLLKTKPNEINWRFLSQNPAKEAMELLRANPREINWEYLSENPNPVAIELLKANHKKIKWAELSKNPNDGAIELLKKNPRKINWQKLSRNPNPEAIKLLKANLDKIDWWYLSLNTNTEAIELLEANSDEIVWPSLSSNPAAIELLKANQHKIDWEALSANPAKEAIELLKANQHKIQHKIDWDELSANPAKEAMELLRANPREINWYYLSENPAIFDEILE